MELQEAIRWTEMHRAMREHPEEKKRSTIFNMQVFLMLSISAVRVAACLRKSFDANFSCFYRYSLEALLIIACFQCQHRNTKIM